MDLYTNPVLVHTWAPFVWQQLAPPAFVQVFAGAVHGIFWRVTYLSTVELISIQVTVEVPGICVFS